MSKKSNTVMFLIAATIFNIFLTFTTLLGLIVFYGKLIAPKLPENATTISLPIMFIVALVLSFVIYRLILKLVMSKIDIDKYFEPLFASRRRKL